MKDDDTKILEEAAANILSEARPDVPIPDMVSGLSGGSFEPKQEKPNGLTVEIQDETGSAPQKALIVRNTDYTVSVKFGNRFAISHANMDDMVQFASAILKVTDG